jgi:DNA-binding MarR family transcriptional regulator
MYITTRERSQSLIINQKTNMFNRPQYRYWKKEDIVYIVKNWNKKDIVKIREHLKVTSSQLTPFISKLRKEGFDLPSKSRNGDLKKFIQQVKKELK